MPVFATFLVRHRNRVLAAAALLGAVVATGLSTSPPGGSEAPHEMIAVIVDAAIPAVRAAAPESVVAASEARDGAKAEAKDTSTEGPPAAATEAAPPASPRKDKSKAAIVIDSDDGKIRVDGPGGTREYDSFEEFVDRAPWIAGLVFMVTFLVFLTPILIVALFIWYKMRKTRMLNETMIRLAEKGVVPPTEAFDAVEGGRPDPMAASPSVAPIYARAKSVREKAAWSDLRKGVIVGAVGLGFTFYSMLDDGSPNFVGLVLLFVGLAYIVLWYFEDRQMTAVRREPPSPPPSA